MLIIFCQLLLYREQFLAVVKSYSTSIKIIIQDILETVDTMHRKEIPQKIIIAISGSSGVIYGIKLLNILRELKIESHLIISKAANLTISIETDYSVEDIKYMADYSYNPSDIGACVSSGSFITNGMIVAPCSMKTLSVIANGYEDNLIARAASVVMKEQKKLVLMTRETPLHAIHLENMLKLSRAGVVISPPVPAFYNHPTSLNDIIIHSLIRVLDLFNIDSSLIKRWDGVYEKSKFNKNNPTNY